MSDNKSILNGVLAFSILSLSIAYFIQYILGHKPCNLCLIERIPYLSAIILVALIISGGVPVLSGLIILTIAHLLRMILYIYLFVILIQVIISWVNPNAYNPITAIMYQVSEPILKPIRRLVPSVGGLDFSPFILLVIINLLMMLIISPLMDRGQILSL